MSAPSNAERPTYIILMAMGVGGAEKRFTELFRRLAMRGRDIYLVSSKSMFRLLLERPDLADLENWRERIILFEPKSASLFSMLGALWPIVRTFPRGSVVHYPLAHFPLVHRFLGHHLIVSWVGTYLPTLKPSMRRLNYVGRLYLGMAEAARIDVLNPAIVERLRKFPRFVSKLHLTAGGTFVDFDQFKPARKHNDIVFLGTQLKAKGVLRFVRSIPAISRRLKAKGHKARFKVIGPRGDASDQIDKMVSDDAFAGIDVVVTESARPAEHLAPARIFLSLQDVSNYPSKALAEAMASGCIPIITDVGESRMMADEAVAKFIDPSIDEDELASACERIFALDERTFADRSAAVRRFAEQRFNIDVQADYFERLYAEVRR